MPYQGVGRKFSFEFEAYIKLQRVGRTTGGMSVVIVMSHANVASTPRQPSKHCMLLAKPPEFTGRKNSCPIVSLYKLCINHQRFIE